MANRSRRLLSLMKMRQNAAQLRIRPQIRQRRMAIRNKDTIKRLQFFIRNRRKWPGASEAILPPHPLDEFLLALALVEVASKGEQGLDIGIGLGDSASPRGECYFVAGVE
jgi:hypothetical protein